MLSTTENNKRIAKNTLILYFRMFITMAIGLYTSRIVLQTLGISDYGIYNLVGGIITMLSFLNVAMVSSSQRFISYELGKNDATRLKIVFSTSLSIHILIAIIALILGETIGLWFINTHLNIDADRMVAANWVYQCSIITFMINVISVPYNSCIIAHEKMSAFAYISILEVTLKLVIVFLLLLTTYDKLIVYALLILLVSIIIRYCYTIYCKRNFEECTFRFNFDKPLFKDMFFFAGWSVLGNIGFSFKDQTSNIILNIFYGTTLNAARGIGMHVNSIVNTFSANFSMALNPQITKQYAAGNIEESRKLVYAGSRYTFYLLTLITIPIIINVDYILELWLGIVPEYTSYFLILSLIASLLYAISGSVTTAIQAVGNIKIFQIGICILMILELPISYLLLYWEYPPYSVMYPTIATYTIAIFFRFYLIKQMVKGYSFKFYITNIIIRCFSIFTICLILCHITTQKIEENFIGLIWSTLVSIFITSIIVYICGINKLERNFINKSINQIKTTITCYLNK